MNHIALAALLLTAKMAHAGMRSDAPLSARFYEWPIDARDTGWTVADQWDGERYGGAAGACGIAEAESMFMRFYAPRPDGWCYVADAPR